jgi:subtilisin-like proprotein convertase family protein
MNLVIFLIFVVFNNYCSGLVVNSTGSCYCGTPIDPCIAPSGIEICGSRLMVSQITVQSIAVEVKITHNHLHEIIVSLKAPNGDRVMLYNSNETVPSNINTIYPTLTQPYESLNRFINVNMPDYWYLIINDHKGSGQKINGLVWSLRINEEIIPASTTSTTTLMSTTSSYSTATSTISFTSAVNISNMQPNQIRDLLTTNQDITPCLLNCSNHGQCFLTNTSRFVCKCTQDYAGSLCNIDKRKCSSNPCLHNSACTDFIDPQGAYSFNCSCSQFHYGIYCENQLDVCANETCSNNGVCKNKNMTAVCECFQLYFGEKCEIESNKAKLIKTTIKFTSILAISILLGFYLIFILIDICNLRESRQRKLFLKKTKSSNKPLVYKFTYKN